MIGFVFLGQSFARPFCACETRLLESGKEFFAMCCVVNKAATGIIGGCTLNEMQF
jgi:hypothetical protein